jgi:hypothetical protein
MLPPPSIPEEGSEGLLGTLGAIRSMIDTVRRSTPPAADLPVRFMVSEDVYANLHKYASREAVYLYGYAALPPGFPASIAVVIHLEYPPLVLGVEYQDGHVESYQF